MSYSKMPDLLSSSTIELTSPDGRFSGFLVEPQTPAKGGIVIIQEIFGVNANMRSIAQTYAQQGYRALVPDLFWRLEPNVSLTDQSQAEWDKAFSLYTRFDVDQGVRDIALAIDYLRVAGCAKVGAIGFCLGGLLAMLTATRTDSDASVSYYGVGMDKLISSELTTLHHPLLLHVAEKDKFVPPDAQAVIVHAASQNEQVTCHVYGGCDHAFAREGGEHYDAQAATLANKRTSDFLAAHLAA